MRDPLPLDFCFIFKNSVQSVSFLFLWTFLVEKSQTTYCENQNHLEKITQDPGEYTALFLHGTFLPTIWLRLSVWQVDVDTEKRTPIEGMGID